MRFLGRESKDYAWQICFNGKLVGVRADNGVVRVTREMSKRGEK
jgi:hypothetical protein